MVRTRMLRLFILIVMTLIPPWSSASEILLSMYVKDGGPGGLGGTHIMTVSDDGSGLAALPNATSLYDYLGASSWDGLIAYSAFHSQGMWGIVVRDISGHLIKKITHGYDDTAPTWVSESRASRWNSESTRIVFVRKVNAKEQLFKVKPDGSKLERLTISSYKDYSPSATEDGHIVFIRETNTSTEIHSIDTTTSWWWPFQRQPRKLFTTPVRVDTLSVAQNNGLIAFCRRADGGLFVSDMHGNGWRQLDPGSCSWPSWSPDRQWIVFEKNRIDAGSTDCYQTSEIYRIKVDGTSLQKIVNNSCAHRPTYLRKPR